MDELGRMFRADSQASLDRLPTDREVSNQQTERDSARPPGGPLHERLFELRSDLTLVTLHQECARNRPDATLQRPPGRGISGVISWSDEHGLAFESSTPLSAGACRVRFLLHGVVFVVDALAMLLTLPGGPVWRLEQPRWFTFDRRVATRLALKEGAASLEWASPQASGWLTSSAVSDLSPGGMQIRVASNGLLPDREVFPAELRIAGQTVQCLAETRQISGTVVDGLAGLRLLTAPDDDSLANIYLSQRFPMLKARHEIPRPELTSMLERSGYLALREDSQVSEAWCGLKLPLASSCDRVYQASDGAVLGMASTTRVYANTWIFHQLATLKGHRETTTCRKTLYALACVPIMYGGESAFAVSYFDIEKRWHRLFFEEFTYWVDDPREAILIKLDRFERSSGDKVEVPAAPGYSVGLASQSELVVATAIARSQLPRVTADALDLQPWCLRSEQLCGAPHSAHYQRSREVLVLRGPAGIEGVALCERGSPEVSLFGILDMAHVFVPGARRSTPLEAQLLLLAKIRELYAEHGISNPLVVSPHGTLQADQEEGTRLVETMGMMAMSSFAIRQWENFCQFHYGHQLRGAE